jgi:hypothetical protein
MTGPVPDQAPGPDDEITCPKCQATVAGRQLVTCPRCGKGLFRQKGSAQTDADAIIQDEVASIDAWLHESIDKFLEDFSDYAGLEPKPPEGMTVEANRPPHPGSAYTWQVHDTWYYSRVGSCVVSYQPQRPGTVAVKFLTSEWILDTSEGSPELKTLTGICVHRGFQLEVSMVARADSSAKHAKDAREKVEWGAVCYLDTHSLSPGLFRSVYRRLRDAVEAAKDALIRKRAACLERKAGRLIGKAAWEPE